jgi:hypothetical protein
VRRVPEPTPTDDDPAPGEAAECEVGALSDAYEDALLRNDVAAMNAAFDDSPEVLRFGLAEIQRGAAELAAWRAAADPVDPRRTITSRTVHQLAPDVVAVDITFANGDDPSLGRQSQTWVRSPAGWKIVRAHVSMMPAPPA